MLIIFIDINECRFVICDSNARCINTLGSYLCACNGGFTGDGKNNCTGKLLNMFAIKTYESESLNLNELPGPCMLQYITYALF